MQLCGILAWMALTSVAASQDFCFDTWVTEPHTASANDCNILSGGPGVVRQSTCVVTLGNKDRTVQWYYTPMREDAGRNGTLVPASVQNISPEDVSARLNISDDTPPGYYWCEVEGPLPTGGVKNPSQVIYIDRPCDVDMYGPCSGFISASSPSQRCALGDEEEDVIIVDIQEITTCPLFTENSDLPEQTNTSGPEASEVNTNMETSVSGGSLASLIGGVTVGAVILVIIATLLGMLICLQYRKKKMSNAEASGKLGKHRAILEKALTLDMTWLAHEMKAVGLLPDDTHEDVIDPRSMLSKAQKATTMVSALEAKVSINPCNLDKFVEILKNKPELFEDIINYLSPHGESDEVQANEETSPSETPV